MFELEVETTFAAAHALRGYHGKCENLHGHNYRVLLTVTGTELDEVGLLIDFKQIKHALHTALAPLDHAYLNELEAFREANPSAENIARYLHHTIAPLIAEASGRRARIARVKVWENDCTAASYLPSTEAPCV